MAARRRSRRRTQQARHQPPVRAPGRVAGRLRLARGGRADAPRASGRSARRDRSGRAVDPGLARGGRDERTRPQIRFQGAGGDRADRPADPRSRRSGRAARAQRPRARTGRRAARGAAPPAQAIPEGDDQPEPGDASLHARSGTGCRPAGACRGWTDRLPARRRRATPQIVRAFRRGGHVAAWNDVHRHPCRDVPGQTRRLRTMGVDGTIDLRSA